MIKNKWNANQDQERVLNRSRLIKENAGGDSKFPASLVQ